MCLAIYKPKDGQLDVARLLEAAKDNPHGCGLAFESGGKMLSTRGLYTAQSFVDYAMHATKGRQAIIHFRFATHGVVSDENCHPFMLSKGWMVAHNGIIPNMGSQLESDTREYIKTCLAPRIRSDKWYPMRTEASQQMMDEIGYSKLVFLSSRGYAIIGESRGEWAGGCWYSVPAYNASADWMFGSTSEYDCGIVDVCDFCQGALHDTGSWSETGLVLCPDCKAAENQLGVLPHARRSDLNATWPKGWKTTKSKIGSWFNK